MAVSSGSGSGADQHLLALLRAIRLRQAAPDAVAAGIADAAAALTRLEEINRQIDAQAGSGPTIGGNGDPHAGPDSQPSAATEDRPSGDQPNKSDKSGQSRPGWATPVPPEASMPGTTSTWPGSAPAQEGKSFFQRGPQLRPPSLVPIDSPQPLPGADGAADKTDPIRGDPGAGTADPARRQTGADKDLAPFDQGEGRPSRNRFAGLTPTRRDQPPAARGEPTQDEHDPIAGRPRWASGERELHARTTPRVPKKETHIAPPMIAAPAGAGVDGMDPADDALLRETQRLLSTSLTFAGGPQEVAARFRKALVTAHPGLVERLPGDEHTQLDLLANGLTWLVHHLDQPPLVVSGCGRLGAALAACGVRAEQLQLVGAALAESMRAGMPAGAWRQDFDLAWRSTWQHVYEWLRHGEVTAGYEPALWTADVVAHELRRPDLAVVRLRPLLPMPFRPGQFARVEVPERPGIWRPYSLAGAPRRDNVVELHVRAKTHTGVSGTLVYRTEVGDRVRLSRAEGDMALPAEPGRNLLMIAGDTGVAPLKALLAELRDTGDSRSAVLFWGVRDLSELYDIDEITDICRAAKRATVVPVISEGDPGPYASGLVTDAVAAYGEWSDHEVYLAGPPLMLAATSSALYRLGVAPDHIHHDAPE